MNRTEFIQELERLLSDLPENERNEAIQYYNDYFDDAGAENEESVIQALGSPETVAMSIRKDNAQEAQYTDAGYSEGNTQANNAIVNADVYQSQNNANTQKGKKSKKKIELEGWQIALIVIGCIIFSPIILALAAIVFGLLVAAVAIVFSICAAGIAVVVALVATLIAIGGVGLAAFVNSAPLVGGMLFGACLVIIGVALVAVWIIVMIFAVFIPWLFRIIKKGWNFVFKKVKVAK